MPSVRNDRRVQRTQRSLHVALNSLILEKGYEHTTIEDIAERANVARSTLYAHHGGKHGLMLSGFQHLRAALLAAQHESARSDTAQRRILAFSRTFFEHVHAYRDLHRALVRSDSRPAVMTAMKRIVAELVREDFLGNSVAPHSAVPLEALERVITDAFFSFLDWWFERNTKLSPADADALFRRLVLPMIAAAERSSH